MAKEGYIIISQENYTLEKALEPYDKKTRDLVMRENERKRVIPAQGYLEYDKVIFVAVMPDDSGSIFGENKLSIDNSNDVIEGHNDVVKALKGSQSADYMQFKTQYLNGRVLNNWFPL